MVLKHGNRVVGFVKDLAMNLLVSTRQVLTLAQTLKTSVEVSDVQKDMEDMKEAVNDKKERQVVAPRACPSDYHNDNTRS